MVSWCGRVLVICTIISCFDLQCHARPSLNLTNLGVGHLESPVLDSVQNRSPRDFGVVSAWRTIKEIGEGCNDTVRCQETDGSQCINGTCTCPGKLTPSADKFKCLLVAQRLGDPCQEDLQCTIRFGPNSRCQDKVCICTEFTVPLIDGFCEPIATDADPRCKEHIQCSTTFGDKSVCVNGMCSCMEDYHTTNASKQCIVNKGLTEDCVSDEDCYLVTDEQDQNLVCTNNSCACPEGYQPSDANHMCIDDVSAAPRVTPVLAVTTCLIFALFYRQGM